MTALSPTHPTLVAELRQLIADARSRAAVAVNAEPTGLYWQVGRRVRQEALGSQRAEYGEEIVSTLSRQLAAEYGRGRGERHLRNCLRIAVTFPEEVIRHTLCAESSRTRLV